MTIVATEDSRNLEWQNSNVGAKLLEKMGWKEGEGIGKRVNKSTTSALRALKRQEGLGLGAKLSTEGGNSESASSFATVLENLQVYHQETKSNEKSKKKKSKKASLTLPQNKVTAGHSQKMREAKFGEKSAKDMACIFGNTDFVVVSSEESVGKSDETSSKRKSKKRSRNTEKEAKKKKQKKQK